MRLAARDIRCALIDLARHYGGPEGRGAHHVSASSISRLAEAGGPLTDTHEPTSLAYWTEFHQSVPQLPDDRAAGVRSDLVSGIDSGGGWSTVGNQRTNRPATLETGMPESA